MSYEKITYDQRKQIALRDMLAFRYAMLNCQGLDIEVDKARYISNYWPNHVISTEEEIMSREIVASQAREIREALENAVDNEIFYTVGLSDPPYVDYNEIEKYLLKNGYVPPKNVNT